MIVVTDAGGDPFAPSFDVHNGGLAIDPNEQQQQQQVHAKKSIVVLE